MGTRAKPARLPTPKQIAARAKVIRKGWDAATRRARRVGQSRAVEVPVYRVIERDGETLFDAVEGDGRD